MLAAINRISNDQNDLPFSVASVWEVAIKRALGRADFLVNPSRFRRALIDNLYLELPITGEHAIAIDTLPTIHKDPFNRMLVAQAQSERIV